MTYIKEQFHIMDCSGDTAIRINAVFYTKESAEEFLKTNLGSDYEKDRHRYDINSNKKKFKKFDGWNK